MQPRVLAVDAWKNVVSRPILSIAVVLLAAFGALASGWSDTSTISSILDDYEVLAGEGYYTLHISRSPQIDGLAAMSNQQCQILQGAEGVVSAGGAVPLDGVRLAAPSGPAIGVWKTDPDLLRAASWTVAGDRQADPLQSQGAVFDDGVAARFGGIDDRSPISLHHDNWVVDLEAVAGATGLLGGGFRESILIAEDLDQIDVCVVVAGPNRREVVEAQAASLFPISHGYLKTWALPTDPTFRSPSDRLSSRVERFAGLIAGTISGALLTALMYGRRYDASTYRLLGLSRRKTAQLLTIQLAIPTLGGVAISAPLYLAYSLHASPTAQLAGWLQWATYVAVASLMITLISISFARHDVIRSLKDQ